MKTLEMYQCEKCLSTYIEKSQAEKCEGYHYDVSRTKLKYEEEEKYPATIDLFFINGDSCHYKFISVKLSEEFDEE